MDVPGHLWQSDHRLDELELKVKFERDGTMRLLAFGRSQTSRKPLWSYHEDFALDGNDLSIGDAVHHLALCVTQDRPRTNHLLRMSMTGGSIWSEAELPFE